MKLGSQNQSQSMRGSTFYEIPQNDFDEQPNTCEPQLNSFRDDLSILAVPRFSIQI